MKMTLKRHQAAWERAARALIMRGGGMTYAEIGEEFGVTRNRARQIVLKIEMVRRWGRPNPIVCPEEFEAHMAQRQIALRAQWRVQPE